MTQKRTAPHLTSSTRFVIGYIFCRLRSTRGGVRTAGTGVLGRMLQYSLGSAIIIIIIIIIITIISQHKHAHHHLLLHLLLHHYRNHQHHQHQAASARRERKRGRERGRERGADWGMSATRTGSAKASLKYHRRKAYAKGAVMITCASEQTREGAEHARCARCVWRRMEEG
eukprot:2995473-Rhodomonas_salina.1